MSSSKSEPLGDALFSLYPNDKPDHLAILRPVTSSVLCQHSLNEVHSVGHDVNGCRLTIELQDTESPTAGVERLTLFCPNHWRDGVLQALLCHVQRTAGGVQCIHQGSSEHEQVMYYTTGHRTRMHLYSEPVVPNFPLPKDGQAKKPTKDRHPYHEVTSLSFATRVRRQFGDLGKLCNAVRSPPPPPPSTLRRRTRSESELTTSCVCLRKFSDLPSPPGQDQRNCDSPYLKPQDVDQIGIELEQGGSEGKLHIPQRSWR